MCLPAVSWIALLSRKFLLARLFAVNATLRERAGRWPDDDLFEATIRSAHRRSGGAQGGAQEKIRIGESAVLPPRSRAASD